MPKPRRHFIPEDNETTSNRRSKTHLSSLLAADRNAVPAKKTIISYLSNKYLWTKCLLVIKTNKTGTTACYLRRKNSFWIPLGYINTLKQITARYFSALYIKARTEKSSTRLIKKALTHIRCGTLGAKRRKKKDCFVRKSNSQTINIQANVVYLPKFYGTKSDFQRCFTSTNRFAIKL